MQTKEKPETTLTFKKTTPPKWLLEFWKEIDDKTFGRGFDCFTEDAICRLGVAQWDGREAIRQNLRAFIDTGFTALHDVVEYWDGGSIKVFRGIVTMTPDDRSKSVVKPVMTHFFYMDEENSRQSPGLVRLGRAGRVLTRVQGDWGRLRSPQSLVIHLDLHENNSRY